MKESVPEGECQEQGGITKDKDSGKDKKGEGKKRRVRGPSDLWILIQRSDGSRKEMEERRGFNKDEMRKEGVWDKKLRVGQDNQGFKK